MIGSPIYSLPLHHPRKIDILRLYFGLPKKISDAQKITSCVKCIEDHYIELAVHIKGTEMIRMKTKRLVKSCKGFISKRKICCKSNPEKQKQEKFHQSIYDSFDVADNSSVDRQTNNSSVQFSDSFSSQESDMPISSDDYHSDPDPGFPDSDHDSDHDSDDPDYNPSEDICSIPNKIPVPSKLLREVSESRGSYRLCENLLNVGVKIAGADPQTYGLSKSNLWKKITSLRSSQKNDLFSSLSADTCKIIVQFDGKCCTRLNQRHIGKEERLIILCHTNKGDVPLGFIGIDSKSGFVCANQILQSLAEHNLSHRVVGMVCDTESTNTGTQNGTCALVEVGLEDDLLHLMCRHHSKECIIRAVFSTVFGRSQSAHITTFDTLINSWDYIRNRNFSFTPINEEKFVDDPLLERMREEAVNVITDHASSKNIREDYAELNDLVLKFFGIRTSKPFRVPGATHNARWMARIIYAIKTYLFRQHFEEDIDFFYSLERFCLFAALIYTKHWNRCSNAVDAPHNDLQLMKELDSYREIDIEIANEALIAHKRHLWYFSDELVVLSLFSGKVLNQDKWNMATQMIRHVEERTENSIRHTSEINDIQNIELHDFISPRSLFLFERLELNFEFLDENPDDWDEMESFKHAKRTILDLITVVNDSAERAIQLGANAITDKRAQSEDRLQDFIISTYDKENSI